MMEQEGGLTLARRVPQRDNKGAQHCEYTRFSERQHPLQNSYLL